MPNDWFRFKKFMVRQDRCAMKVGTDGVLLGAWCDVSESRSVLDAGTGTGIIALMCAQRSRAGIVGLEIDPGAASQAGENFARSPWGDRLKIINGDIRDTSLLSADKFELIVCNPPYFKNSRLSHQNERNIARHNILVQLEELMERFISLLEPGGTISLILPFERFGESREFFSEKGLFLKRKTLVASRPGMENIRVLAEWSSSFREPVISQVFIYTEDPGEYHPDYISLTKNFYLAMP